MNIQQGGHILIWFGLTWSLELYQQTNARLWRQGQTDVVTIHHIKNANELPEANRRLLDLLYETAWHTIYVFKYGIAPEKVPAPWYDRMGGVEK